MAQRVKKTEKRGRSMDMPPRKPVGQGASHDSQTRLAVNLPISTHRQLKARAAAGGSSIRDYILDMLRRNGIE